MTTWQVDEDLTVEERHAQSRKVARLRYISRQEQVAAVLKPTCRRAARRAPRAPQAGEPPRGAQMVSPFWSFLMNKCVFAPKGHRQDDLLPGDPQGRTCVPAPPRPREHRRAGWRR
jgi:hypothetical protein